MAKSQPNEIGLVSGETANGPASAILSPEQEAEQRETASETAIETADAIARKRGAAIVTLEDGTVVEVRNAKVGQIGTVLRFMKHMIKKLEIVSTKDDYLEARFDELVDDPVQMIEVFEVAEGHIWAILAALTSLNETEVKDLDLDDAMKVARVTWEMNKAFFLKKVLPLALGTIRAK